MNLIRACHPGPAAVVSLLVTALALAWGRTLSGTVLVFVTVLSGQLSIGWSNDLVDAPRDRATGRRDKPVVAGLVTTRTLAIWTGVALAACAPLSLLSGMRAGLVHLVVVAAGWAYNLGLKATVLSFLPYVIAFGALPAFVTLGAPDAEWPPWWVMAAGALLGIGAHIANVLPDIEQDVSVGVHGMPQRLGDRARWIAPLPLAAATLLLVLAPPGRVTATGWAGLAAVAVLLLVVLFLPARIGRGRGPFLATLTIAVIDVALLLSGPGS